MVVEDFKGSPSLFMSGYVDVSSYVVDGLLDVNNFCIGARYTPYKARQESQCLAFIGLLQPSCVPLCLPGLLGRLSEGDAGWGPLFSLDAPLTSAG